MKISRRALTAAFILAEALLFLLIITNVVVVDNVRWVFFAIIFAYVAAIIGVTRNPKRRN